MLAAVLPFVPIEDCGGCCDSYVAVVPGFALPRFWGSVDTAEKSLFFPSGIVFVFEPLYPAGGCGLP